MGGGEAVQGWTWTRSPVPKGLTVKAITVVTVGFLRIIHSHVLSDDVELEISVRLRTVRGPLGKRSLMGPATG
jgi:hypothetical protein